SRARPTSSRPRSSVPATAEPRLRTGSRAPRGPNPLREKSPSGGRAPPFARCSSVLDLRHAARGAREAPRGLRLGRQVLLGLADQRAQQRAVAARGILAIAAEIHRLATGQRGDELDRLPRLRAAHLRAVFAG